MTIQLDDIRAGIIDGSVVPFIGAGALAGVTHKVSGKQIPATSDELILAMNNGQPMAPRLMYEFPRAAMNVELKRGRTAVNRFLETTYADNGWNESPFHAWLASQNPAYIVDINRDSGLQKLWATRPHLLVVGVARIAGTAFRYKIYEYDAHAYKEVSEEGGFNQNLPVLFKPTGSPWPTPNWIASDADFVDYITELMGGFAIPGFLKKRRMGLKYVLAGVRLNRDTERMLLSEIIWGAAQPAGWVLIPEPTDKERRFCTRLGLEVIEADLADLMDTQVTA